MKTTNDQYTPQLNDMNIVFHSSCLSDGQAFFNGLPSGNYDINISKSGYVDSTEPAFPVTSGWQDFEETLFVP